MTTERQMVNVSIDGAEPKYLEPEAWLWCIHCEKFFQVKELLDAEVGGKSKCPTKKCKGSGFGKDIFKWDAWAGAGASRLKNWPTSVEELKSGQKCRLDV
jgi:hypothetical protein